MNNKIRALATQATNYCREEYKDYEGYTAWLWEEKFGELIIQECLKTLDPSDDLCSMREEYGRIHSMNMLKEHFGI